MGQCFPMLFIRGSQMGCKFSACIGNSGLSFATSKQDSSDKRAKQLHINDLVFGRRTKWRCHRSTGSREFLDVGIHVFFVVTYNGLNVIRHVGQNVVSIFVRSEFVVDPKVSLQLAQVRNLDGSGNTLLNLSDSSLDTRDNTVVAVDHHKSFQNTICVKQHEQTRISFTLY